MPFEWNEYVKLAQAMRSIKGKAILSINDHPKIRELFAAFQMESLDITYTLSGGDNAVKRGELIIYSWDRAAEPAGLF